MMRHEANLNNNHVGKNAECQKGGKQEPVGSILELNSQFIFCYQTHLIVCRCATALAQDVFIKTNTISKGQLFVQRFDIAQPVVEKLCF